MRNNYDSWGGVTKHRYKEIIQIDSRINVKKVFTNFKDINSQILTYGNGRSYGDVAYNDGGIIIDGIYANRFIDFDYQKGILTAESGITLCEVLQLIVPQGWFLAVTPGTKFITLGGAVANDVHGKNHHCDGSFGDFVLEFELYRSNGDRIICSRNQNVEYFYATIGGIGLTGYISWVKIQLLKIMNPYIVTNSYRFHNLQEFFMLNNELEFKNKYTVSWLDCVATDNKMGRGVYFTGDHAGLQVDMPIYRNKTRTFLITPPFSLVNSLSLKAFNFLYYNKPLKSGIIHYESFFYPLDGLYKWNRIYGKKGFYQYQCVVPKNVAYDSISQMLKYINKSGLGSFLAVLKTFGNKASGGLLSFAREGVTLALDFPNISEKTLELFKSLDAIVKEANGTLYIAKDARMSSDMFNKGYPNLNEFKKYKDTQFSSNLWRRVT